MTCIKLCVSGDSKSGKSCLVAQLNKSSFSGEYSETTHCTSSSITFKEGVVAQLFDWSANQILPNRDQYFDGSHFVLLTYDISNRSSFEGACSNWFASVIPPDLRPNVLLIGCKNDLTQKRAVAIKEAENFATQNSIYFIEVSSKDTTNIALLTRILSIRVASAMKRLGITAPPPPTPPSDPVADNGGLLPNSSEFVSEAIGGQPDHKSLSSGEVRPVSTNPLNGTESSTFQPRDALKQHGYQPETFPSTSTSQVVNPLPNASQFVVPPEAYDATATFNPHQQQMQSTSSFPNFNTGVETTGVEVPSDREGQRRPVQYPNPTRSSGQNEIATTNQQHAQMQAQQLVNMIQNMSLSSAHSMTHHKHEDSFSTSTGLESPYSASSPSFDPLRGPVPMAPIVLGGSSGGMVNARDMHSMGRGFDTRMGQGFFVQPQPVAAQPPLTASARSIEHVASQLNQIALQDLIGQQNQSAATTAPGGGVDLTRSLGHQQSSSAFTYPLLSPRSAAVAQIKLNELLNSPRDVGQPLGTVGLSLPPPPTISSTTTGEPRLKLPFLSPSPPHGPSGGGAGGLSHLSAEFGDLQPHQHHLGTSTFSLFNTSTSVNPALNPGVANSGLHGQSMMPSLHLSEILETSMAGSSSFLGISGIAPASPPFDRRDPGQSKARSAPSDHPTNFNLTEEQKNEIFALSAQLGGGASESADTKSIFQNFDKYFGSGQDSNSLALAALMKHAESLPTQPKSTLTTKPTRQSRLQAAVAAKSGTSGDRPRSAGRQRPTTPTGSGATRSRSKSTERLSRDGVPITEVFLGDPSAPLDRSSSRGKPRPTSASRSRSNDPASFSTRQGASDRDFQPSSTASTPRELSLSSSTKKSTSGSGKSSAALAALSRTQSTISNTSAPVALVAGDGLSTNGLSLLVNSSSTSSLKSRIPNLSSQPSNDGAGSGRNTSAGKTRPTSARGQKELSTGKPEGEYSSGGLSQSQRSSTGRPTSATRPASARDGPTMFSSSSSRPVPLLQQQPHSGSQHLLSAGGSPTSSPHSITLSGPIDKRIGTASGKLGYTPPSTPDTSANPAPRRAFTMPTTLSTIVEMIPASPPAPPPPPPELEVVPEQVLFIDINIGDGRTGQIAVRHDSNPQQLAEKFIKAFKLDRNQFLRKLTHLIQAKAQSFFDTRPIVVPATDVPSVRKPIEQKPFRLATEERASRSSSANSKLVMRLHVDIGRGKFGVIAVKEGDDPTTLARTFVHTFSLRKELIKDIANRIEEELERRAHDLKMQAQQTQQESEVLETSMSAFQAEESQPPTPAAAHPAPTEPTTGPLPLGNRSPIVVDIDFGGGRVEKLQISPGEAPELAAQNFILKFGLPMHVHQHLVTMLRQSLSA